MSEQIKAEALDGLIAIPAAPIVLIQKTAGPERHAVGGSVGQSAKHAFRRIHEADSLRENNSGVLPLADKIIR